MKNKLDPSFESRPTGKHIDKIKTKPAGSIFCFLPEKKSIFYPHTGPKHRQRFLCELRIKTLAYVGAGNSTNRKDAEKNAARDFISHLVQSGRISAAEAPDVGGGGGGGNDAVVINPAAIQHQQQRTNNVFKEGLGPQDLGSAYRPVSNDGGGGGGYGPQSYLDRANQQLRMEDAESLDVNAGIHGNWTIENAKAKLHQFMQMNKIVADYRYQPVGPDHARYLYIRLLFFFPSITKN